MLSGQYLHKIKITDFPEGEMLEKICTRCTTDRFIYGLLFPTFQFMYFTLLITLTSLLFIL